MSEEEDIWSEGPRCWAFGPDMRRCDLRGGHDGHHAVTASWADHESLSFEGMLAVTEAVVFPPAPPPQPVEAPVATVRLCGACDHPWHEVDACGGPGVVPGELCDCRTPV